jgi:hypothetical protein
MYSLGFLPLIIFMRGVAGVALLLDIIQLHFFILQEVMFTKNSMAKVIFYSVKGRLYALFLSLMSVLLSVVIQVGDGFLEKPFDRSATIRLALLPDDCHAR